MFTYFKKSKETLQFEKKSHISEFDDFFRENSLVTSNIAI